ncbi:MAG: bifunctional biotin--[acetyl-CoA-carboxylase] ligase/biotin operon repressor BirA [Ketobacter sp.]|uniref:bifunctional biotin--[acetyl-CoA-carboxylase] ligase/biotin operon repressor BirA n=1 Tax=Ketobacter sp. GenoA1 TaxID=2072747 RepID=UPI0025B81D33|nr:bifunctional biotin--[acetyl-CoA-carboxylase] ligase/biotin operon repressor BirA [Ketobacter sp. GenoA1]
MSRNNPHSADDRFQELIALLADGRFHGGDELGDSLGVSRAAVWKQIQKLQESGLDIQSVRGKGYRLAHPMEWLDTEQVCSQMDDGARALLSQLDVRSQVTSTNDVALQRAATGVGSGYVCLAEQQTAGRGRRGRHWVSPFGSNLYLSIVWEFHQGAAQLEGLSLATGVAVAKALSRLGVSAVGLKWPNDLLVGGAKLSGILLEMTGDPSGRCQVVLGVGVNHRLPMAAAHGIDQSWAKLDEFRPGIGRNLLASVVISELLLMLERFAANGFAAFRDEWQALDVYADKEVVIKTGASDIFGIARGVDSSGGLRLEISGAIQIIKGGEMSLRAVE